LLTTPEINAGAKDLAEFIEAPEINTRKKDLRKYHYGNNN